MDKRLPFTYLFLSASLDDELRQELAGWHMGDILEGFLEMETQAETLEDLWCYRWEKTMARIAPVQMTAYVDVRPWIVSVLGDPTERIDKDGEYSGSTFYYPHPLTLQLPEGWHKEAGDRGRMFTVLAATAELARLRGDGILFVGCWGFRYGDEVPLDQQALMIQAGFQFVDRSASQEGPKVSKTRQK